MFEEIVFESCITELSADVETIFSPILRHISFWHIPNLPASPKDTGSHLFEINFAKIDFS